MRKRTSIWLGALLGGLTSLPLVALFYLGEQFAGLPSLPLDLFDWVARTLPGDLITLGIDSMVQVISLLNVGPTSVVAKAMEQVSGVAMFIGGAVVLGAAVAWVSGRLHRPGWQVGTGGGLLFFLAGLLVTFGLGGVEQPIVEVAWLFALIVGWGAVLGALLAGPVAESAAAVEPSAEGADGDRRAVLLKIAGGSAAVALGAWGLGRLLQGQAAETGAGQPLADLPATATPRPTATPGAASTATPAAGSTAGGSTALPEPTATATVRDRLPPAPGTRLELTPTEDFYRIDINTRPPAIDGDSWQLEVAGLFDDARPLTLDDLTAYPPVVQPITLSCISNRIAGDLISTGNWIGVRLRDVLKDLKLRPEAGALYIEAQDGFYETVVMEDMMDPRTLLVYGMNGETLPVGHGYPLRIYIPNRYGMKQPKWIVRIEAVEGERKGYWVDRGWSLEARPKIVSVIDTVATEDAADGRVPVGGIAWAGDRGIQKVEVQIDGGEWTEARLRTPPLGPLTWVQWRYDWPAEAGRHTLRVRATDGTGALQTEAKSTPHPDGATGYHEVDARV